LTADFTWRDAGRTVVFRRGAAAAATRLLAEHGVEGYELISTARALAAAPELAAAAGAVHEVGPGGVAELAGGLLAKAGAGPFVALGGGRVIDVAKGLAGERGTRLAAIPTTMSGAEMTSSHRIPAGGGRRAEAGVRPALVIADPELMTSQAEPDLRASSMNALAHGADTLYLRSSNPVSEMTALRGAALIAAALDEEGVGRDRGALALGSILCGYAIDSAGIGFHHLVCQTLVRFCGTPHAGTNAAVLPHSVAFLAAQAPEPYESFAAEIGTDLANLATRIKDLGRPRPLSELGADPTKLEAALEAMLERPELRAVPAPPTREELGELVAAAW
jgi:maleylacetate reductase